ncbi:malonate transporter, MadL subunit [Dethiosulfatibacter aminovorans DSM 17477]|uniref:Malonate transporter, MadL subunit n=1 Tax=Dethiosulfatibacter aminovorans DSM 17477 TaxID=1121476 RepID=A0A1M6LT30_9FIRM|nr:malonate transporter subunit MadL [Dethiosulfatibacter aminovorans]SHJ74236.1 malonate transporter, MadL subunit [Dethiosulfatibacter aminovorans DSM 17477]
MEIYGFGIVAICMYIGSFIGMTLGKVLGISGNVGGVGFAMLMLVVFTNYRESKGKPLSERTQNGIRLLSALYIPIIVAMAANQNVVAAFEGGAVAFLAGGVATIGAILLVPVISKLTAGKNDVEKDLGGKRA